MNKKSYEDIHAEWRRNMTKARNLENRRNDLLTNPPMVILDDSEVINKIWNYVNSTKRLTKRDLRKLMTGLVKR